MPAMCDCIAASLSSTLHDLEQTLDAQDALLHVRIARIWNIQVQVCLTYILYSFQ